MLRKVLSLSLLLVLALSAVALATRGGDTAAPERTAAAAPAPDGQSPTSRAVSRLDRSSGNDRGHRRGPHSGIARRIAATVLASSADRLGVETPALRTALKAVYREQREAAVKAAGLTAADTANLKACHRRTTACDRTAARRSVTRLKAQRPAPAQLAGLRDDLAADVGERVGKTGAEVLTAARAELDARLGQAATLGFVTKDARALALACFDAPADCDVQALKAQVRFGGHGRKGRSSHQG